MAFSTESEQLLRFSHPFLVPQRPADDSVSRTLRWINGDRQSPQVQTGVTVIASGSAIFKIEPPNPLEEWEIDFISLRDSAAIDINDDVNIAYVNQDSAVFIPIGFINLKTWDIDAQNRAMFPNKDTALKAAINYGGMRLGPLLCRRKNNNLSDWFVQVTYKATVVAGTRTLTLETVYRKRRVE